MSLLVVVLPPRPRGDAPLAPPAEYAYVLSPDGRSVSRQGSLPASGLPRADSVCAVLADADLSWHRVDVPRAPAAKLRDALGAVLEEQLLEDPESVHLALEPAASGGQPAWVAVTYKAWLSALLADLEGAGHGVQRVLPPAWPEAMPHLHALPPLHDGDPPTLVLSHAAGVERLSLGGSFARSAIARLGAVQLPCSAHPSVVAATERWLGAPLTVLGDAERALQATRSAWNLRQFDLAARHRGARALRALLHGLATPEWRPLRVALGLLVVLQLAGLNAWAWRQERTLRERQQSMTQLLQSTHPGERTVLDAPLQMRRETDRLRAAAGRPGASDLEPMLAAAAAAWPPGAPPLRMLQFVPGRLTLETAAWADAQRATFVERVRAAGYAAEPRADQLVLTRAERT